MGGRTALAAPYDHAGLGEEHGCRIWRTPRRTAISVKHNLHGTGWPCHGPFLDSAAHPNLTAPSRREKGRSLYVATFSHTEAGQRLYLPAAQPCLLSRMRLNE